MNARRIVGSGVALALAGVLSAQISPAPTADELARFDANRNGAIDGAEVQALLAARQSGPASAPAPSATDPNVPVVTLSPFEVEATTNGYYASNSLSGTRLNTRIEDLASSITVITKQQLQDTAAVDVNDIFMYEANTEGTYQYTDYVIDRGFQVDTVAQSPQTANRVRGMGAANVARGNFAASSAIPVDTYNLDSVEISRGPNSNIFGLGESSGTVNLIVGRALLDREITSGSLRIDDRSGWRTSVDLNRPIVKDRLALRIQGMGEQAGYVRKPSVNKTNRLTLAATAKPFRSTTLRLSYESYHNYAQRPNSTTPRDAITEWQEAGMPTWNPLTQTVRYPNGQTIGPIAKNQEVNLLPRGISPEFNTLWARPSLFIEPNGEVSLYTVNNAHTTLAPNFNSQVRFQQSSTLILRGGGAHGEPLLPLYQAPGVTDRGLYDYLNVNLFAPNFSKDKADLYQVELEQWFIDTRRHRLALQAGFFREDIDRASRAFLGASDGAPPILRVDINEFLFDGTPNPYFMRPYIIASEPQIIRRPEINDNYRATLAYELDYSNENGWRRWVGRQRFAGYGEFRQVRNSPAGLRSRDRIVSDEAWMTGAALTNLSSRGADTNLAPRYLTGGPINQTGTFVQYAPAAPARPSGTYDFVYYPFSTNSGPQVPAVEQVEIGEVFFSGNGRKREIRTQGLVWQGFLWKERIVPTMGWRRDKTREVSSLPLVLDPDTRMLDPSGVWNFSDAWIENEGSTRTRGIVFKPFPWLNLHYNESDSFLPEPVSYNAFLEQVPNPTGEGKDYGFSINLFDGKLIAKINKYETVQKNSRSGTSGALTQRMFRPYFDPSTPVSLNTAGTALNNNSDPFDLEQQATTWMLYQNPGWTLEQARAEALRLYLEPAGITAELIDFVRNIGGGRLSEVNTVTSTGLELELAYNPSRYWTIKLTGAKQQAIDSELSPNFEKFINLHVPAWQAVMVPNIINPNTGEPVPGAGQDWWNTAYGSGAAGQARGFYESLILAPFRLATANAGKPRPQTREWRFNATTNYRLAGLTDQKHLRRMSVGGALRWEDKAVVGYFGGAPSSDGAVREYDPNRPIFDKARTYVDLMATYETRLFDDRVRARFQLNVRNAFEGGRLQAIAYNPDGQAWNFRIIDPRQFILTASFDL